MTVGFAKCPGVIPSEDVVFNLPELTDASGMFYGANSDPTHKISFTDGSLSKVTKADNFCADGQRL